MKGYRIHIILLFFAAALFITPFCMKEHLEPYPFPLRFVQQKLHSEQTGTVISLQNCQLWVSPGVIPFTADGNLAEVIFTLSTETDLPIPIGGDIKLISGPYHFGPEGIIFQEPVWLIFKKPVEYEINEFTIFSFDFETLQYKCYPITYLDEEHQYVGTAVYQLGIFFLGNHSLLHTNTMSKKMAGFATHVVDPYSGNTASWYPVDGNVWEPTLAGSDGVWNSQYNTVELTTEQGISLNPEIETCYFEPHHWVIATPPYITTWLPNHEKGVRFIGPLGNYAWHMKVKHRKEPLLPYQCQTYSPPIYIELENPLECEDDVCQNWKTLPAPALHGNWQHVLCENEFLNQQDPLCTGDIQITLGWHNGMTHSADLDLHLLGPDGMRIYWGMPLGPGDIWLDNDVTTEQGFVLENICAPNIYAIPRGLYQIEVRNYSGTEKMYQLRVIRGNYIKQYYGTVSPGEHAEIEMFRIR